MQHNVIVDQDGVILCTRVPRPEVKRLQEKRMVLPHRRKPGTWWALVAPAIITQQLRRKVTLMIPMAEANRTVILRKETSHTGQPVRYYEPNFRTCFSY